MKGKFTLSLKFFKSASSKKVWISSTVRPTRRLSVMMDRRRKKKMNMKQVTVGKGTFPLSKKIDPYSNSQDIMIRIFRTESRDWQKQSVKSKIVILSVESIFVKPNKQEGHESQEQRQQQTDYEAFKESWKMVIYFPMTGNCLMQMRRCIQARVRTTAYTSQT